MKKQLIYLLASTALLAGCSEKEADGPESGFGRIRIACGADITVDTRAAAAPSGDDFSLKITGDEGYEGEWATVGEFAAQDSLFKSGDYKAEIFWGDPEAEGTDKPYFAGAETLHLKPMYTATVQITAKIANSQVLVRATKQFLHYFHDAEFTVETGSGNKFVFKPALDADGSILAEDPVYVKAATSLAVTGKARKQSQTGTIEGIAVTFAKQTLDRTKPCTRHIFEFDAKNAGSATLTITLGEDENPIIIPDVELNEGAIPDNE